MLFDPKPKERRRELFDRDEELRTLERLTRTGSPITLLLGIRRIGKTSVLKTFLNESSKPHVFIDARKLSELGYSKAGLYTILSEEFTKLKNKLSTVTQYLKLRGVKISGFGVEFDWRSKELSISSILERMNEFAGRNDTVFLLAIDEAQLLRFMRGGGRIDFRQIIAYSYDNLENVKFLLSGSEVGLLHEFLGLEDPESPLYGRLHDTVTLERFSAKDSLKFLELGFNEIGVNVPDTVLERAVETLDGIPGWLAYFGYEYAKTKNLEVVDQILDSAINLALNEVKKLGSYSTLYVHVLRAVAMGFKRWSRIKRTVEAWLGRPISNQTLTRILKNLEKMSILKSNREYEFLDPVVREASKRL